MPSWNLKNLVEIRDPWVVQAEQDSDQKAKRF
jgi:hypothetical protein